MKKVEEFQKTQQLMDEYKDLENKIPELENQIKKNEEEASRRIERLEDQLNLTWEDVEFEIDKKSLQEEIKKQIDGDDGIKVQLDKENAKISHEIEEIKDSKKYFRTDAHFKTITMEIEEMKKEVSKGELELKQKNLELQEFYAEEKHENPLRWQEIYKEQDELKKNIEELNAKIEEYSKFKNELNSIKLTPEEYKIMFEREAQGQQTQGQQTQGQQTQGQQTQGQQTQGQQTQGQQTQGQQTQGQQTQGQQTQGQQTQGQQTQGQQTQGQQTQGQQTQGQQTQGQQTQGQQTQSPKTTDQTAQEQSTQNKKPYIEISFNAKENCYKYKIYNEKNGPHQKGIIGREDTHVTHLELDEYCYKHDIYDEYDPDRKYDERLWDDFVDSADDALIVTLLEIDKKTNGNILKEYYKFYRNLNEKNMHNVKFNFDMRGVYGEQNDIDESRQLMKMANFHKEYREEDTVKKGFSKIIEFVDKYSPIPIVESYKNSRQYGILSKLPKVKMPKLLPQGTETDEREVKDTSYEGPEFLRPKRKDEVEQSKEVKSEKPRPFIDLTGNYEQEVNDEIKKQEENTRKSVSEFMKSEEGEVKIGANRYTEEEVVEVIEDSFPIEDENTTDFYSKSDVNQNTTDSKQFRYNYSHDKDGNPLKVDEKKAQKDTSSKSTEDKENEWEHLEEENDGIDLTQI